VIGFSKDQQTRNSGGGKGTMRERQNRELIEVDEVVNSKRKGNVYELHIVKLVQSWFPKRNIRRSGMLQSTKAHGVGDFLGWPSVMPEVKDCQSLSMFEWLRKLVESCELTQNMPVLFFHQPASKSFKRRDEDWMVCRVEDFPFLATDFVEQQLKNREEAG
jgi:hypothetical protein